MFKANSIIPTMERIVKNSRFDIPTPEAKSFMDRLVNGWDCITRAEWKSGYYEIVIQNDLYPEGQLFYLAYDATEQAVYTAVLSLRNSWSFKK